MPISTLEVETCTCTAYRHARRDLQVFRNCEFVYTNLSNAFANLGFGPMPFKRILASVISPLSYILCRVTPPRSASVGAKTPLEEREIGLSLQQHNSTHSCTLSCNFVFSQCTNNDSMAQTAAWGVTHIRIGMWANTPPNDVGSDSKQRHKYILDIAIGMMLLMDFPQQQQVSYS